ncbi:hypothetical protein PIB30_004172 [Stylosanthes scabra]|uniref:Uncharacterized protein n=1 Tax=Stylosanthes scabra TaxID=79078 RepID=A0ABU6R3X6_9FABA|nr:hypothetical protein [Stylosanthes scabra]
MLKANGKETHRCRSPRFGTDGTRTLWFGRDAFGRRSLLVHWPTQDDSTFLLSSVSPIFPTEQTSDQIDLLNVSFDVQFAPDRISSKARLKELKRVAPSRRWRLVEIDSELSDLVFKTSHVMSLINPANTYMDLNIGIALWLAADGDGWMSDANIDDNDDENPAPVKHKSSARILLVGSGADEQQSYRRGRVSLSASVELSPCVASRSRAQVVGSLGASVELSPCVASRSRAQVVGSLGASVELSPCVASRSRAQVVGSLGASVELSPCVASRSRAQVVLHVLAQDAWFFAPDCPFVSMWWKALRIEKICFET